MRVTDGDADGLGPDVQAAELAAVWQRCRKLGSGGRDQGRHAATRRSTSARIAPQNKA